MWAGGESRGVSTARFACCARAWALKLMRGCVCGGCVPPQDAAEWLHEHSVIHTLLKANLHQRQYADLVRGGEGTRCRHPPAAPRPPRAPSSRFLCAPLPAMPSSR